MRCEAKVIRDRFQWNHQHKRKHILLVWMAHCVLIKEVRMRCWCTSMSRIPLHLFLFVQIKAEIQFYTNFAWISAQDFRIQACAHALVKQETGKTRANCRAESAQKGKNVTSWAIVRSDSNLSVSHDNCLVSYSRRAGSRWTCLEPTFSIARGSYGGVKRMV